jgi:hypothetical protein
MDLDMLDELSLSPRKDRNVVFSTLSRLALKTTQPIRWVPVAL